MSRKLRSQHWFGGLDKDAFIHRSWMKNNGLPDDAFDGRPVIGICNTFSELTPCNAHFRGLIEHIKAGVLEATDGLTPSAYGKRVKLENGKATVIDGPFTESKELVASYAILNTKTIEEAVYWTTRFLEVLGGGECEVRPIIAKDWGGSCGPESAG